MKKKINPYEKVTWFDDDLIIDSTSYYWRNGCFCDCLEGPQEYDGNKDLWALQLRANYMIDVLVEEYEIEKHVAELVICEYVKKTNLYEDKLGNLLDCLCHLETILRVIAENIKKNQEEINENISVKWLYEKILGKIDLFT